MPDQARLLAGIVALIVAAVALALGFEGDAPEQTAESPRTLAAASPAAPVDHFILALSWSPAYCAEEASERDARQCKSERSYAFIVHGLWPQDGKGGPRDCPTDRPRVPDDIVQTMLDLMPSPGLIGHQWRTHGACTGLTQEAYFRLTRRAAERVRIPDAYRALASTLSVSPEEVERAFIAANPGLEADMLYPTCSDRSLREVRICLTADLAFRPCGSERSQCRRDRIAMPPVR